MHVRDHRADELGRKELLAIADGSTGRAPSPGAKCCSISSVAAWRLRPSWPPAPGRSVSGKPCARSTGRRASSAVGCTRPPTCSTSSRSPSSHAPSSTDRHRWPRPARWPRRPSTSSSRPMAPSTTKRWPAWPRTATCCSPSTTSRPSTGSTFAPPIPSKAPLDRAPQDDQPPRPRAASAALTALTMVFKLCQSPLQEVASPGRLAPDHADIVQGVKFKDGEKLTERAPGNLRHQLLTIAHGSDGGLSEGCLELGESHFDGIEVGRIRRQIEQVAPACSMVARTPVTLWAGRLSMTTMSPGANSGTSTWVT